MRTEEELPPLQQTRPCVARGVSGQKCENSGLGMQNCNASRGKQPINLHTM